VRYNGEAGAFINTWAPLVTGGAAVTAHIVRGVFLDIGVDIVNVLSSDDFKTSYLRPMIGLGGNFQENMEACAFLVFPVVYHGEAA
jgi:hypothetical protein